MSTNIQVLPGKVGISNTSPIHTLDIGSNVYVDDTAENKLTVVGKIYTTDITVASNLQVMGTTTVVNTENLSIKDPIIELARDSVGTGDTGILMKRAVNESNVAVFYDEGVGFKIAHTMSGANGTHITVDAANTLPISLHGNVTVTSNLEVGTANLFVDTVSGNVGVGTNDPGATLDVHGSANVGALTATTVTATTFTGSMSKSLSAGNYLTGDAYNGSTDRTFDVDATSDNTGGKVVARDASGNFSANVITGNTLKVSGGGGTEIGISDDYLGVNPYTYFRNSNDNDASYFNFLHNYTIVTQSGSGPNNEIMSLRLYSISNGTTDADTRAYIPGRLGIGVSSPSYKLDVHGTSNVGALTATSATVPNDGDFVMGGKPLKPAAGLHWDRVNSRLGVGTNNPLYTLDVNGTANAGALNTTGGINNGSYAAAQGYMKGRTLTIGDTLVNYGGHTNQWRSDVPTAGFLMECSDNTEMAIHDGGSRLASFMYYEGGSTNRFTIGRNMGWGAISTISLNGDVGIGTTSPDYKLDVHGTSNVGALTATSVSGDGSGLTGLNATNLSSGIVPSARLSLDASDIPKLDATQITTGTLGRPISTTTGTFSGNVTTGPNLYVGTNTNDETSKSIYFGGTYGDNGYDHCVIERRVWETGTEKQELLLFSGNDGETVSGPDRIRLKGAQILFDTLNSSTDRITENTKMIIRADGKVGIGTTSPSYKLHVDGDIYATGDVIMFSDERKKTNIEVIPNALEKVLQLRGVTFEKLDDGNRRHSGIIAQEVEKVLPEVVYTAEDGTKSVAYGNMIGLLIEAIKELTGKS